MEWLHTLSIVFGCDSLTRPLAILAFFKLLVQLKDYFVFVSHGGVIFIAQLFERLLILFLLLDCDLVTLIQFPVRLFQIMIRYDRAHALDLEFVILHLVVF